MRVEYGIRAVMDLVENYGRGLLRSADIAERRAIPEAFLDQVLMDLRKAGIIRSLRGPAGGHELAHPPTSLSLGDIIRSLGETPLTVACMREDHCIVSSSCVLQDVWHELIDRYDEILNGTLVTDLVRREAERKARDIYHI